jgi:dTDP-4-amino-4,6-dideoxygalactose transaminase
MKATNSIKEVEAWLSSYVGREFCCLTGRGTTAIDVILKAAAKGKSKMKVVLPAIIPPSLPNTALLAGYEPIFCDVSIKDFNMDINSLKEIIESEKDVTAIMPVHLYGYPADMDNILKVASDNDLFVVEDFAQALGAEYKGAKCGSFGDASITSFGHTKILECGGGGAVLTDDAKLFDLIRAGLKRVPAYSEEIHRKEDLYRQVYYLLKPVMDLSDDMNMLYFEVPKIFETIFRYGISDETAKKIAGQKDNLEFYIQRRRENAKIYQHILCHPNIVHPKYEQENGVYWRYSFLLNTENVREITEKARHQGIDVSNWYPPIYRWYPSSRKQEPKKFSNAQYVGNHIVNLWTLPSFSKERIESIARTFLGVLEGNF